MAGVHRGEALAEEDVPEMTTAVGAGDLGSVSIGIGGSGDGALDFLVDPHRASNLWAE